MIPTINLDDRTFDDIKEEALRLIPRYCPEWTNHNESDPGITLIELFSWMTEMTLYRLNKVPQKNYLSMLELMGLSLTTPQSSRAIIQFYPVENCEKNILVKKGTKIASVISETRPVIFETEKDLLVRDVKLISCINRNRENYSEKIFETEKNISFSLFETQNSIEHVLYLSSSIFKFLKLGHIIQLSFDAIGEILSVQDEIINHLYFEYWDGRAWVEIKTFSSVKGIKKVDNVLYIKGPLDIEECTVNDYSGFFIRAVLSDVPEKNEVTVLKNVQVKSIFEGEGFIPDVCIKNSNGSYEVIDINNAFRMFEENPSYNEIFYVAADEILKNKKAKVTMAFSFSEVYVPESVNENALFSFEYWNGKDWEKLSNSEYNFRDSTFSFKQPGQVTFIVPKDIKKTLVNNEEHYFIRIRLVTKDFAIGGTYVQDEKGNFQWNFNSKVQSPLLSKIRITYDASKQDLEKVISYSSFKWNEISDFTSSNKHDKEVPIFVLDKEHLPAMYLGFSSKIKDGEFPIYFEIDNDKINRNENFSDVDVRNLLQHEQNDGVRFVNIIWEYWNGEKWRKLDFTDFTDSFHESGYINFNIPSDIENQVLYQRDCFWIRAVKLNGSFEKQPLIKQIVINSVYAENADTYRNEVAGSGNGAPGQTFQVAHPNLLPGIKVVVNEGSIPSENELEKMRKDGIKEPYEEIDKQVWVNYKEVPNFYNSDAFSRHFVIDYSTGRIIFGDGVRGINPPKGKFNIKVSEYKVGGGEIGNVAAHKLQFLTQSIPYIAGCDNPFPAEGGCDMETVENLKSRSAGVFKSLNRAVTCEDFEWLSCEASSSVGRAFCLKNKTKDGRIRTIIVPKRNNDFDLSTKLIPSKELLRRVGRYLDDRKLVGTSILLTGPIYRDFKIHLDLVFKNNVFDVEYEKSQIKKQLFYFFDPLCGDSGNGFEFGKNVTKGLILTNLEKNQSVLSVNGLEIFDNESNIMVETLFMREDELPYLFDVEIIDRRA